jgi:hypothetical protein
VKLDSSATAWWSNATTSTSQSRADGWVTSDRIGNYLTERCARHSAARTGSPKAHVFRSRNVLEMRRSRIAWHRQHRQHRRHLQHRRYRRYRWLQTAEDERVEDVRADRVPCYLSAQSLIFVRLFANSGCRRCLAAAYGSGCRGNSPASMQTHLRAPPLWPQHSVPPA